MTDKITLELTLDELKELDKNLYYCEETWSICDKIRAAYPQPKMTLQQEGDYAVVSYNDTTYYRFMNETTFAWYIKKGVSVTHPVPTLVMVTDAETERLLDGLYYNYIEVKKETTQERGERVHNEMEEMISKFKGQSLYDLIDDWWSDIFTSHSDLNMETSIDDLVSRVEAWLPKEHDTNSYKWNQCIRTIKEKLR